YSSPLERCRESGEILANLLHCPVLYSDDLKEIHMGSWENIPIKHIKEKNPTAYALRGAHMADYICPGGESFSMVQKRALKALSETVSHASKEDTLLFVTHAGVIRSLLCFYENQPLENLFQYKIGYGEAVILPSSLFCY
ncbi:MAG: histidine phosphatase family protein, partial [Blautia sp.]